MKQKISKAVIPALAVVFAFYCGPKKREMATDLPSAVKQAVSILNETASGLEKAGSGKDAAKVMNAFYDNYYALEDKFPALKARPLSAEVLAVDPNFKDAEDKFGNAFVTVLKKYEEDADVKAALKRSR